MSDFHKTTDSAYFCFVPLPRCRDTPFSGLVAALVVVFDQLALSGGVYCVYGTG